MVSGSVAPWRDPTLLQRTGLLVWGGCKVAAVRLKIPDGGGVSGLVAPWRDPTVWQRTGLLAGGGCMVF